MSDFDRNRLASLFREFLEEGADEKALRLFLAVLVDEPASKSPKTHAPKTEIQQRAAEIAKETWQVASTGEILPGYYDSARGEFKPVPQLSVPGPPEKYAWTKTLSGYEAAVSSAVSAVHRSWAPTQAAAAGHKSKTPSLDQFLFLIRAGRIKRGDPRIQQAIAYADKYGFSGNIRERITQELHNAEKRVPKEYCDFKASASLFYDINCFHITLASLWVRCLFWLMPDKLILDFLLRNRAGPPTTRQGISQAVSQMELVKHQPPIVKSIGRDSKLVFVEGYPPKS
jgi:hypothetical protein